ncbi:MAG: creatininase family protein [Vicinamibacteria bacterium]|nr:creatininase family protein [Vicinamibacteria bacterium]
MTENDLIAEMSWTEIDEALKDRPVAMLPIGSMQAHGPHLPVSTHTIIALEVSRRAAARLRGKRIAALVLPPLPYSVSEMSADFAGTVTLSSETLKALLSDICGSSAKRFRAIVLVCLQIEPRQVEGVKSAAETLKKAGMSVCWTDLTKKRWIELLGDTFASGDHAGAFATSIIMAACPERVRDSVRRSLPPVDGLFAGIKKGAKTFIDAGGEDGYFGDPTAASAEDGESNLDTLAEIVTVTTMELLGSKA